MAETGCLPAITPLNKIVLILRRACEVIFERESAEEHRHQRTGAVQCIRLPPWCGDLFTALRREGLIADEFVLQLVTFLRSLDLSLELIVLAPRTLTAKQVRHGGKAAECAKVVNLASWSDDSRSSLELHEPTVTASS